MSRRTQVKYNGKDYPNLRDIYWNFFEGFKEAYYEHEVGNIILIHNRKALRCMGIWTLKTDKASGMYRLFNNIMIVLISLFIISISCDLSEAISNIYQLGDDLVVLLGLILILFKIIFHRQWADEIDEIINEFVQLDADFKITLRNQKQMSLWQCDYYMWDIFFLTNYLILSVTLFGAICVQPLFSAQPFPFRSKYPFGWEDSGSHPIMYLLIYGFQAVCTIYALLSINLMDNMVCNFFKMTSLNLKLLALRINNMGGSIKKAESRTEHSHKLLKELHSIIKLHQRIISLIDTINKCYYINYLAQMLSSTFMICLTAFEALLAKDQPMVAIKFLIYMFAAFGQLFYWCWRGNMAFFDSLEVATALYDISKWYEESSVFQKDLQFVIKRAQKPLAFRAKPFDAFNFETFTNILSSSYSAFTVLKTVNK